MSYYLYMVLSVSRKKKDGTIYSGHVMFLSPSKNEAERFSKNSLGSRVVELDKNDFEFLRINLPFYDNHMNSKETT